MGYNIVMITPEERLRIKAELTAPMQRIDPKCQAVVVLSAAPRVKIEPRLYGPGYDELELNRLRVNRGVEAWKLLRRRPLFIVNGEDDVVNVMGKTAVESGVPSNLVLKLPCGPSGVANTLDNMRVINNSEEMKRVSRITFVTSQESGPRVLRLADMILEARFMFMVLPLLCKEYPHVTIRALINELHKIENGADPRIYPEKTSPLFPDRSRLIPEE